MSARYYPYDTFLDARRGFDPSYVWFSIWGAKSLLLEGLKWRLGNGEKIGVWDEAWLPGDSSSIVPPPKIESLAHLKVADFMNDEGAWG